MESRQKYLSELREYIDKTSNEVTMILQSLQWDRNSLHQCKEKVFCKFDSNHIIPVEKQKEHEEKCYIKSQGYAQDDLLLPEPLNPEAPTVVRLDSNNIKDILENATKSDPLFKTGNRNESVPLTLERLQATYTADERRAIHDAVVNTVPSFHDLSDLALSSEDTGAPKQKSRLQVLAELRDMKRRRTRYRVAVPTKNYSHVLKHVIATQMELYTAAQDSIKFKIKTEPDDSRDDDYHNVKDDHHPTTQTTSIHLEKHTERKERESYKDKYDVRGDKKYDKRYHSTKDTDKRYDKYDDRKRHYSYKDKSERYVSASSRSGDSRDRNKKEFSSRSRNNDRADRNGDGHNSIKERYWDYKYEKRRRYD